MARDSSRGVRDAGWGWTAFAGIVAFVYFFPVLWIIITAFKTYNDAMAVPAKFLFTPTLENFASVFNRAYSAGAQAVNTCFELFFFSSLLCAGSSVLFALIIRTLAA